MGDLIDRQAALDCFHDWIDKYGDVHTPDEMSEYRAIEALPSAQLAQDLTKGCTDTISRRAAIETAENVAYAVDEHGSAEGWLAMLVNSLGVLPSAQPEPQWIPCSERMPDQYGNYLISIEGDEPDIGTINPNDPRGWSLCDANGFYWASDKYLNITAWMPIPEPYKERR